MKSISLFIVSFLLMIALSGQAFSQLINYGRRSRFLRMNNSSEEPYPSWATELPEPQNEEERRYDSNRDGLLQSAEVKVYLRSIIELVENRGYVSVTTDLLREYDKNKDGAINANEIELIKEHVK